MIADLIELAKRGRLRVPHFQRAFIWDEEDVRLLFDSIWRGFPIGTLLLWSRSAPPDKVSFGPVTIDAEATDGALWVVDGQQRVTTLVGALAETAAVASRFDVYFDLRRAKFFHARKRPTPWWWLPLRVTLESRTLLGWLRENGERLEPEELDLADELAGTLRDYKIPAYIVDHDDPQLLRDVFDRVNSAGKRISRAQVFHALFGGDTEVESAGAIIASLRREGFGDIDDQRVVQSLLAIRGGDVARDLHDEFASNESRAEWFDDTDQALSRTIRFLRQQGVPHLQLVPSTFPMPVLAAFFHLHPNSEPWIERLLARWLWRGWAHGYGRKGPTPALRQAVRAVHPAKGSPEMAPSAYEAVETLLSAVPDDPAPPIGVDGFRTDSATGRLALLALAHLAPRSLTGEPIELAVELDRHGVSAITELVPGHRSNLAARGFWPGVGPFPTGHEGSDILSSHAIDDAGAAALRDGDVDRFLRERTRSIEELTARFLARRMEPGATIRPPLAELFVPDDDLGDVE